MSAKELQLRRPDTCVACATSLDAGTRAWWDATARTVTCLRCRAAAASQAPSASSDVAEVPALDRGHAGASALREYERRRANRETRVRTAHPRIGGVLLWLNDEPQHQRSWVSGGEGEKAIGTRLEARTSEGPAIVLHDRRIRPGRTNIDHLAVAPTGVYVIDAKAHKGKVRIENPLFGSAKLKIKGRDQTKLIDGLDRQVAAVRAALARDGHGDVPVHGALCFTNADLPFLRTQTFRGHLLLYGRALAKRLNADGPLDAATIEAIAGRLAHALPAA